MPTPYYRDAHAELYCGDCLRLLELLPAEQIDVVLTDPPYSSGGLFRGDRSAPTTTKYSKRQEPRPGYLGDNRDQRSFERWVALWSAECLRATREGGALLLFCDWRNLAAAIDAVQMGGWIYRGIVGWDKSEGVRPVKGWYRAQLEFVVCGTRGPIERGPKAPGDCAPGLFRVVVEHGAERFDESQKPVALLMRLLKVRRDWLTVLDPFAGYGSTLVAAKQLGLRSVGYELDADRCRLAAERLGQGVLPLTA